MNGAAQAQPLQAPVQLAQVHGRDSFGPRGTSLGRIDNVTLLLEAGLNAFVGAAADGTAALCEILAGRRRPRQGAVTVAGRDPAASPALRRRLGVLLPVADLPPASTVDEVVTWVQTTRGVVLDAPLDAIGVATLGGRRPASLTAEEARAVGLALALALPEPLALVLYEPFAAVGPADVVRARELVAARAAAGCCVVIATSTPSDVDDLVEAARGRIHLLEHGRLVAGPEGLRWPPPRRGELTVWVQSSAEELSAFVAALGRGRQVVGVQWRAEPGEPASVTVRAEDVVAAAHAVAQATRDGRVQVLAVDHQPPDRSGLVQLGVSQRLEAARAQAPASSPLAEAQRVSPIRAQGSEPPAEPTSAPGSEP